MRTAVIRLSFAGVNGNAHSQRHCRRPLFLAQRQLKLAGCRHRVAWTLKNREHAVAFPAFENDGAVIRFDCLRYDLIMPLKGDARFRRIRFPCARRSFHVREEKGYGPNRACGHHSNMKTDLDSAMPELKQYVKSGWA